MLYLVVELYDERKVGVSEKDIIAMVSKREIYSRVYYFNENYTIEYISKGFQKGWGLEKGE